MEPEITLTPMTARMYHAFFRDYKNDADLYLDKSEFREYTYDRETVDAYIRRQIALKRLPFAILYGDEMAGELKFYDIKPHESAVLGITMKSSQYKDRGFGTQAERLAIDYAFHKLDIPVLYAAAVLTNTRSQYVLEKVGFQLISQDARRKYYRISRVE